MQCSKDKTLPLGFNNADARIKNDNKKKARTNPVPQEEKEKKFMQNRNRRRSICSPKKTKPAGKQTEVGQAGCWVPASAAVLL